MDRRNLIRTVSYSCALLALRSRGLAAQFPPGQSKKQNSPHGGLEDTAIVGCSLSGAQEGNLRGRLRPSCGNPFVDRSFGGAYPVLNNTFAVTPGFAFFDDSDSPNAFATPDQLTGQGMGTVVFGTRLLGNEISSAPATWGSALTLILAHEWAHILQYRLGFQGDTPHREQHADCMGGWFLGLFSRSTNGMGVDITTAARSIFSKGDLAFNDPTHHGTPDERLFAVLDGYQMVTMGVMNPQQAFQMAANKVNAR